MLSLGRGLYGIIKRTSKYCYIQNRKALMFFPLKAMGANDPQGGTIFDAMGMFGRIYKEDHYALLHTKYESSGPWNDQ